MIRLPGAWDQPLEWRPENCDGCSVPSLLRFVFPVENDRQISNCCCPHDEAYHRGGSEQERERADQLLYSCLVANGFSTFRAWQYYRAVRTFGAEHWQLLNRKAWGYGKRGVPQ